MTAGSGRHHITIEQLWQKWALRCTCGFYRVVTHNHIREAGLTAGEYLKWAKDQHRKKVEHDG